MISKDIIVMNKDGLHAELAMKFVALAKSFPCKVNVKKVSESRTVDGKSNIMLMSGGYKKGDKISVVCDGGDEEKACAELITLISNFPD